MAKLLQLKLEETIRNLSPANSDEPAHDSFIAIKNKLYTDEKTIDLDKAGEYWLTATDLLKPGDSYWVIVDGEELADPASLLQAAGVHGSSTAFDLHAFKWSDKDWRTPDLKDFIIYELHTGTFTPEGDFNGIIRKLDHLKELGVTAIELMPVAQFPGERNWGYDGVFPFAVQNSYGGPLELQHLVDVCHQKGLSVILDVVYNHIGPEGNYLSKFGPYFTEKHHTPWGPAVNFDDEYADGVREFFIENVLMWFRDFHIDALRMDAVHAFKDESAKHILAEMKAHVDLLNEDQDSNHLLMIECDLNDRRYLDPIRCNGLGMDAQWVDEFHHALRVTAGGERKGYYEDFNGIQDLADAYEQGYVYNGKYSMHRKRRFGSNTNELEGQRFIVFSQNHDQVGNRMLGERSSQLFSFEMQKLMAAAVFISPFIPLLFMGEEWAEKQPFQYFVSHSDPELIEAVRNGRSKEFKAFQTDSEVPDPQSEQTFLNSKLRWDTLDQKSHLPIFEYYKDLIKLRKENPVLKNQDRSGLKATASESMQMLEVHRKFEEQELICFLNFSGSEQKIQIPDNKEGWSLIFDSSSAAYGGSPSASNEGINAISIHIYYRLNKS